MFALFKSLFAPISRSLILGEKYWEELVSDLNTFAHKGCKIAAQTKLVFLRILPYEQDFLLSLLLSASVERCFVSRMRDFFIFLFFNFTRQIICRCLKWLAILLSLSADKVRKACKVWACTLFLREI